MTRAALASFREANTCLSTGASAAVSARPNTPTTSDSEVVDFLAELGRRTGAERKPRKNGSATRSCKTSRRPRSETLTFVKASARYWNEVGRHHRNSVDTKRSLAWLLDEIGMTTPVSSIGNALVASLVAKRRADGVSPATVNRQVIEPLRGMLRRASDLWGADVRRIDWKRHALPEPQERVRELTDAEEAAFFAACREDYAPLYRFALLSGCRMAECIDLEWRAIDWRARTIRVTGKGARTRLVPLTDAMVTLLRRLPRAHARVFTYEKRRAGDGARGERRPIRYESLKSDFARTIARAGIEDFRFHDFRHTAATRLLRATGNLRLVQKLLGHSDIATTTRYAHATGDDLLSAMNRAESASAAARTPAETPAMRDSASDK